MKKLKIATIVGTRPEIIRLSRIISKLDFYCDHTLIHSGQNYDYELNQVFFDDLSIRKPDVFLQAAANSSVATIGNILISSERILLDLMPDALLVLGDTNSCLSVIAAKRLKIPIFHMEAGNRCFDLNVPEEINRKIVDHTSDINLTYSAIARDYLLSEGFPPDQVIKTGSPMGEVISYYFNDIIASNILSQLELSENNYFLVSCHREENVDSPENLFKFLDLLKQLAQKYDMPVIVSTHPRTKSRLSSLASDVISDSRIQFMKPFGFFDYNKLQLSARAVISDSGTITEESSILNFHALNLRSVHERPEGFEEGSVMMVGLDVDRVCQCLEILNLQDRGSKSRTINLVQDYSPLNVSEKVIRVIHSYVNFVNKRVWNKSCI